MLKIHQDWGVKVTHMHLNLHPIMRKYEMDMVDRCGGGARPLELARCSVVDTWVTTCVNAPYQNATLLNSDNAKDPSHIRLQTSKVVRLCGWNFGAMNVPDLYTLLSSEQLDRTVVTKIRRVNQRSTRGSPCTTRVDFFVSKDKFNELFSFLSNYSKLQGYGWLLKKHRSYSVRHAQSKNVPQEKPKNQVLNTPSDPSKNIIASWNVAGAKKKIEDVKYFLLQQNVKILGMQETLRPNASRHINLPGFTTYEGLCYVRDVTGQRGVSISIHNTLGSVRVGSRDNPYFVFAKVTSSSWSQSWIFGSVYIPSQWSLRSKAMRQLRDEVASLKKTHNHIPIVLVGDFNQSAEKVSTSLKRQRVKVAKVRGSAQTWHRVKERKFVSSAIDHILHYNTANYLSHSHVIRKYDSSDHWPIVATVLPSAEGFSKPKVAAKQSMVWRKLKLREQPGLVANHNYWDPLLALPDTYTGEDLDKFAKEFIDVSHSIAKQTQMEEKDCGRRYDQRISSKSKRQIRHRQRLYKQWIRSVKKGTSDEPVLRREYLDMKKSVRKLRSLEWKKAHERNVRSMLDSMKSLDLYGVWRWVTGRIRPPPDSSDRLNAVRNGDRLITDPAEIKSEWTNFYKQLVTDKNDDPLRDHEYWSRMSESLKQYPICTSVNNEIDWPEICSAIQRLRSNRASGIDQLPPEFFKCMVTTQNDGLLSKSSVVMTKLIQNIWRLQHVPEVWRQALICSIPKPGDPELFDNYRGISLIPIAMKILTSILSERISAHLTKHNILRMEQAGFRSREECVGHVIALVDIIQWRLNNGKRTYTCFIDFKKAFDTVPHEALLAKVGKTGIQGRALEVLRQIYISSEQRVLFPDGFGEKFPMKKGVRQGDPASPVLFNIFINDILDGCTDLGVKVGALQRVAGLIFADDLVLIAPSRRKLRALLDRVTKWSNTWGMKVGISKCGILPYGLDEKSRLSLANDPLHLQGEVVPIVTKYKYLGVIINDRLNFDDMQLNTVAKVDNTLKAIQPFIVNRGIPLPVRIMVFKALVIPRATYAGELLGMNQKYSFKIQSAVNIGMRWLIGNSSNNTLAAVAAMQTELNIPPIHAIMSAKRARFYRKVTTLRTWVTKCEHIPRVWYTKTRTWLRRNAIETINVLDPSEINQMVLKKLWTKAKVDSTAQRYKLYEEIQLERTRGYVQDSKIRPDIGMGFSWLSKWRCGGLFTVEILAKINMVRKEWMTMCPFCEKEEPEDDKHLMLTCAAWSKERKEYLGEYITSITEMLRCGKDDATHDNIARLLMGGNIPGVSQQLWWTSTETLASMGPRRLGFIRVAEYLNEVVRVRQGIISKEIQRLNPPSRADAPEE